jgi:Ca2+-binding EF-hand superfamily protein
MTSISSLGSSNAWSSAIQSQRSRQSAKLAEKLSANFDADGDGSLNETELQSLMDDIGSRRQSGGSSAKDLLSSSDSNADGSLSTDELEAALPSMLPPPRSTMDFAQSRGAGQSDDLFSKVDSDGSGDEQRRADGAAAEDERPGERERGRRSGPVQPARQRRRRQPEPGRIRCRPTPERRRHAPPPPAQASASTESDSDSTGTAAASGVGSRRRRLDHHRLRRTGHQ